MTLTSLKQPAQGYFSSAAIAAVHLESDAFRLQRHSRHSLEKSSKFWPI
jgi:hypothetical protein